ncbi:hypothetical protein VPH35_065025 [Triticum aestivum]|uniref:Uncharacterized protein n=1 Tax=Triticum urartu TaxID=4572 RepID=A0A8R7Q6I0_TRIUA
MLDGTPVAVDGLHTHHIGRPTPVYGTRHMGACPCGARPLQAHAETKFLFARRREKTTLPEVALDLSPIIVSGTALLQQQHQKRYHWTLKASMQGTLTHTDDN